MSANASTILPLSRAVQSVGQVTYNNALYTTNHAAINASSSGNNTLVAGVSLKQIVVLQYDYERADAVTIIIKSSGGRVLHGPCGPSVLGGGKAPPFSPVGHFRTDVGEGLVMNLDAAIQVGGSLTYILI